MESIFTQGAAVLVYRNVNVECTYIHIHTNLTDAFAAGVIVFGVGGCHCCCRQLS